MASRTGRSSNSSSSELQPNSIPLITFSRTPSPYPRKNSNPTSYASSEVEDDSFDDSSRRPFLSEGHQPVAKGWKGLLYGGGLGHWLFATAVGWQFYVGFLLFWLGGCAIGLILMNRIILLTGVYKFPYPLTTTLFELLITHFLLIVLANLTRLLAPWLRIAGLSAAIAPPDPWQSQGSPRVRGRSNIVSRLFRAIFGRSGGIAGGGVFEFEWSVARQAIAASVIFVGKVVLSNLSFAYAQFPIYTQARIGIVPLSLLLTATLGRTPHSVGLMSAALTATMNLLIATSRSDIRVTWESIVAGVFSSFFVALFPLQLQRTYRALVADLVPQGDLLTGFAPSYSNVPVDASGSKEESRATWRLMHYTSLLSIAILTPLVFLSGEVGLISRNCYFLDVFFHWLMVTCGGIGSWATFLGTVMMVKATSPLTTSFLFIPRAAFLLPVLSKFKMPAYSWVGVGLCWVSCLWFLRARRRESRILERLRAGM